MKEKLRYTDAHERPAATVNEEQARCRCSRLRRSTSFRCVGTCGDVDAHRHSVERVLLRLAMYYQLSYIYMQMQMQIEGWKNLQSVPVIRFNFQTQMQKLPQF